MLENTSSPCLQASALGNQNSESCTDAYRDKAQVGSDNFFSWKSCRVFIPKSGIQRDKRNLRSCGCTHTCSWGTKMGEIWILSNCLSHTWTFKNQEGFIHIEFHVGNKWTTAVVGHDGTGVTPTNFPLRGRCRLGTYSPILLLFLTCLFWRCCDKSKIRR